ncbi:MAG: prepilin peptidase [Desulfobacterales bacterium]|nr:MAG: prepilin peptidase [Desulfobacterales bacterium]
MHLFITTLLAVAVVVAAIVDLKCQKIPNALTFSFAGITILFYTVAAGKQGLITSLAGCATGLGIYLIPYLIGWMGAGDTKLLGAIGSAVGVKGVVSVFILTSLAGGLYVAILYICNSIFLKTMVLGRYPGFGNVTCWIEQRGFLSLQKIQNAKICYGIFIAIGTLFHILFEVKGTDVLSIFFN